MLISWVLVFTCIPYNVGLRSVPLGWPQMQVDIADDHPFGMSR